MNTTTLLPKQTLKKMIRRLAPEGLLGRARGFMPARLRSLLPKMPPLPTTITIDPGNVCNLRCPLCPTGAGKRPGKGTLMSLSTFRTVLDKFPTLEHIWLFNWGEPFLNPDLLEMIAHAKRRGVRVTVHTNLSFKKDDEFFAAVVRSGLDRLTVSLDGASQETYEKYRVGGDFGLVVANIRRLTETRDRLSGTTPGVIWKFVVNKYNEREIPTAQRIAADLGVAFSVAKMGLSDDLPDCTMDGSLAQRKNDWLPRNEQYLLDRYVGGYQRPLNDGPCAELSRTMVVSPDGKVLPCCWVTDEANAFGDLLRESIHEIWHNSMYTYSRGLFDRAVSRGRAMQTICSRCANYTKIQP